MKKTTWANLGVDALTNHKKTHFIGLRNADHSRERFGLGLSAMEANPGIVWEPEKRTSLSWLRPLRHALIIWSEKAESRNCTEGSGPLKWNRKPRTCEAVDVAVSAVASVKGKPQSLCVFNERMCSAIENADLKPQVWRSGRRQHMVRRLKRRAKTSAQTGAGKWNHRLKVNLRRHHHHHHDRRSSGEMPHF